ncbi:S41 family peptidase [Pseudobacteriovorax antillogorgiicola]|uniref:Carboxyl-terminal processing protease n=1 Tax=Pseudobacteriovorax antillogorgiicola TaxID=1513793 RepID=A0A1Y6C501_9BACT|nr:S41 family peptidase [Pseudobacteriovorax antillogorgiicola]TCS49487.1 carboxyl-terminal processing protease [Pseudobacteriovorax antillogorgiicola]SMF46051.1 carboxyl-terminal processing protease [Pseudobacteriovorax antillogorgiicola]
MFKNLSLAVTLGLALSVSAAEKNPSGNRYKSIETLAKGLFYLENLYVDPNKVVYEDMVYEAMKGVVTQLDPHTVVMPRRAFKQLTIDTQGKFGGIGIIVSTENKRLIIVRPIEDTPAHKAGIKSGDEIIAIDGVKVEDMKGSQATEMMRGKPDTKINLTIKREKQKEPLEFTIIREIIKVKSVRSEFLGQGILYTRIASFQDNTADEMQGTLTKNKDKIKGIVLDLRDNPGGLLDQAVRITDMFVESGLIVSTVGRTKKDIEREFAHKRGTFSSFPIVTLINGGSASASEIVAGALQDHERSLVMGTTSFGKGSVQTLVSLPDSSGLKITVARYFTPKDRSIQAKGIAPDVYVSAAVDQKPRMKKESDLKGHIKGEDLSDMARDSGIQSEFSQWPYIFRNDRQLQVAYTYLRGWKRIKSKNDIDNKL